MMSDKELEKKILDCCAEARDKIKEERESTPCIICSILEDGKERVDSVADFLIEKFAEDNFSKPECARKVKEVFENEISELALFKKILNEKQYKKFLDSLVFVSANPDHLVLLLSMLRNVFVPMAKTYETLLTVLTNNKA